MGKMFDLLSGPGGGGQEKGPREEPNKMLLNLEPSPYSNPRLNADEMFHLGIVEHGEGEGNQAPPRLR